VQTYSVIYIGIFTALALTLLWAAGTDLKYRIISNKLSLTIVGLFSVFAVTQLITGADWKDTLLWPLAAAAIILLIGMGLFAAGMMGGGDVKLLATIALFSGPDLSLSFILYVTIAGGFVALATLLHTRIRAADPKTTKVPYGVAICLGGLWVCVHRVSAISA